MKKLVAVAAVLVSLGAVLPLAAASAGRSTPRATADAPALEDATGTITVLVHGSGPGVAAEAARAAGLTVLGELRSIHVAVVAGAAERVRALVGAPGVTHVEVNRTLPLHLETARTATRVAEQRTTAGMGFDGRGETIAVVDGGVDGTHPMFRRPDGSSKVVRNFRIACHDVLCSRGNAEPFFVEVADSDSEGAGGHGTHVAGIAAGRDVKTADGHALAGVAPGADVIAFGSGATIEIYGAAASLDWIVRHHADPCGNRACPPITVVNNSYGPDGAAWDPESAIAKLEVELVKRGVTVVFSNGNGDAFGDGGDGSDNRSNPYAQAPFLGVLAVANYDDADSGTRDGALDGSSSRGQKDQPATWPDLSAPGTNITSACRAYQPMCDGALSSDPNYGTISGTSMAAPHVSGAVAVLQQAARAHLGRRLSPAEVENLLEDSAHKFGAGAAYAPDPSNSDNPSSFDKGHGLLDLVNAINLLRGAPLTTASAGPAAAAAACAPDARLVEDPKGDATGFAIADTGSNEPTLDVTRVGVSGDPAKQELVVTFRFADLTARNPSGTTGIQVEGTLNVGDFTVDLSARRAGSGATFIANDTEVAGAFDPAKDTVTVRVPRAVIGTGAFGQLRVSALADGFTRRSYDPTPLGPTADEFSGTCGRTVDVGGVGFVAAPGAPFRWTGEPTTAVTDPLVGNSLTLEGTHDDVRAVDVRVPAGGTVVFDLTCDTAWDDFDIQLAGPNGKPIGKGSAGTGHSANGGCVEQIVVKNAPAGRYVATVIAFATAGGVYRATLRIA